jgi:hypothetical protein
MVHPLTTDGSNAYSRYRRRNFRSRALVRLFSMSTQSSLSIPDIDGLLPTVQFERFNALHETLRELRKQIPILLSIPLAEHEAAKVYTADTRLTVGVDDPVELASDLKELLSLSNAFVMSLAASTRAGAFLSSFGQQSKPHNDPTVECQIILDSPSTIGNGRDSIRLKVTWEATLIQSPISETIQGVSMLSICPDTSKVFLHELISVTWRGALLDPAVVGQSLSVLRQTVKSVQDAPLLQPLISTASTLPLESSFLGIFNQVRDEFMQQQLQVYGQRKHPLAPLFVSRELNTTGLQSSNSTNTTSRCVPIEEFNQDRGVPLPGSNDWDDYAACHSTASHFVRVVIPNLSKDDSSAGKALFRPDARIISLDGKILLQGAKSVSNFYNSLAAARRRTSGVWNLLRASVTEWKKAAPNDSTAHGYSIRVAVDYSTVLSIPGLKPTTIRGTDCYIISTPDTLELDIEGLFIEEIQQEQLSIGDNSNPNDGVLFMRSLTTAVETTGLLPAINDGIWEELLQGTASEVRQSNENKREIEMQFPLRSDKVALVTYRVMEALHRDWSAFEVVAKKGVDSPRKSNMAPAYQYMTETMQLQGLLGETLMRGRAQYNRIFAVVSSTFQSAPLVGSLAVEEQPTVKIELTPIGNVVCSVTLYFKLSPPNFAGIPSLSKSSTSGSTNTLPLKIFIASEYVICPFTGYILQHRLIESRVNGQLTPGDVVAKWIQRLSGAASAGRESDDTALDWLRSLQDTVDWVRSINSST